MPKPRIALLGGNFFPAKGGTSRVIENLLLALKDDFQFTVYCFPHPRAATHLPGVRVVQIPVLPVRGLGVYLFYFCCTLHLLWRGGQDLVHLHKTDGAVFLPLLRLRFRTVATSHARPQLNDKWSALGKWYFRLAERIFVASRSELTSVARTTADYYAKRYGRRVTYIPNGIYPAEETAPELAKTLLSKYQLSTGFLLFAARRVIPLKGCHTLLKALQMLDFKGTLVVAGDLSHLPAYTAELRQLARGMDVRFIGYVEGMDRLNALLRAAALFVFPSEIEAMSMMLLETATVGTPIVASDIPQNTAVLSEEEVLFFANKNPADLAAKLRWAQQNPAALQALALRAKNRVEQQYSMAAVADEYRRLYLGILR